jgi:hypothetical protein
MTFMDLDYDFSSTSLGLAGFNQNSFRAQAVTSD